MQTMCTKRGINNFDNRRMRMLALTSAKVRATQKRRKNNMSLGEEPENKCGGKKKYCKSSGSESNLADWNVSVRTLSGRNESLRYQTVRNQSVRNETAREPSVRNESAINCRCGIYRCGSKRVGVNRLGINRLGI